MTNGKAGNDTKNYQGLLPRINLGATVTNNIVARVLMPRPYAEDKPRRYGD